MKKKELRKAYIRGLRSLYQGMRSHANHGNRNCVRNKEQEIEGYLLAGLYTHVLNEDEYTKAFKITNDVYVKLMFENN